MRKTLLIMSAAAALSFAGVLCDHATAGAASPPAASAVNTPLIREAAIVCGGNGCNPVHTKADKKRKFQTLGHG